MRPFVLFLALIATPAFAKMGLGVDVCDMSPVQSWLSASGLAAPAELPELKEVMFSGNEDICGKSFVGNKLFGSAPDVSWGGRLDSIPLAHHLKHTVVLLDIDAEMFDDDLARVVADLLAAVKGCVRRVVAVGAVSADSEPRASSRTLVHSIILRPRRSPRRSVSS